MTPKYKITYDVKTKIATLYIWEWFKWKKIDNYATVEMAENRMKRLAINPLQEYYYDTYGNKDFEVKQNNYGQITVE
jgi:hypothetical protein